MVYSVNHIQSTCVKKLQVNTQPVSKSDRLFKNLCKNVTGQRYTCLKKLQVGDLSLFNFFISKAIKSKYIHNQLFICYFQNSEKSSLSFSKMCLCIYKLFKFDTQRLSCLFCKKGKKLRNLFFCFPRNQI